VFLRGDSNADGRLSISDPLMTRRWLFNFQQPPPCLAAADSDDNNLVDLTDVIDTLCGVFLTQCGASPGQRYLLPPEERFAPPFPEVGPDPTPGLECEQYQVEPPLETEDVVRIGDVTATPGSEVRIPVYLTSSVEVEAFQLVVRYDPALFTPGGSKLGVGTDFVGTPWDLPNAPSFHGQYLYPDAGFFVTGVVGSLTGTKSDDSPFPPLPPGENQLLFHLKGKVSENAVPGTTIVLEPTNGPNGEGVLPPMNLRNELTHRGEARFLSVVPRTEAGALAIVSDIGFFIRGDANSDRKVDVSDALHVFSYLFLGGPDPDCPDASDADDNGKLDITDGVVVLGTLFLGGHISEPYPLGGTDATADDLGPCAKH
jgi:hypothetical protein